MAFDLDKALHFITSNGNGFQKNYLKSLFGNPNLEDTLEYLSKFQNSDGGWIGLDTDYIGKASSITCTMIALGKFERLQLSSGNLIDSTIAYLKKEQKQRGLWDESIGVLESQPPDWYYPKTSKNQVWFTNGILRYVISRKPQEQEMISKARGFLRSYWEEKGFPGYEHNNWMGIVGFYSSEEPMDHDIYKKCMENVRNRIHEYDFSDVNWALESLMSLKFPKTDPIVIEGIEILKSAQAEDGGFITEYGDLHRVDTTIDALDTFAFYGVIPRSIELASSEWI